MAYDCRVYRILIASPSDVEEEREIAVSVIQEWNDLYSYVRKVALLPLRWETHTAPEYGTRPQEVINRAIVDECDLLVGIFWTRIGSPTGAADSGTLEEIERVGKAEKPIMLYFSNVETDPDKIELDQIEKLRKFKKKSYPKELIESYKKIMEFRDKFSKQLEIKVRDLQLSDASRKTPLSLEFLSIEKGEPIGSAVSHSFDHPNLTDVVAVPEEKRDKLQKLVRVAVREKSYFPIALAIANSSASGVRNLYAELYFSATSKNLELSQTTLSRVRSIWSHAAISSWAPYYDPFAESDGRPKIADRVQETLARFQEGTLQRTDGGWRLSFAWEALQPQRIRLIMPVLYLYSAESAELSISAKVFADSFPEPLLLQANVSVEAKQTSVSLENLLPNWEKILRESEVENAGVGTSVFARSLLSAIASETP